MEDIQATVLTRPADTVGHSGQLPQIFFVLSQVLLCSEKFVLNI